MAKNGRQSGGGRRVPPLRSRQPSVTSARGIGCALLHGLGLVIKLWMWIVDGGFRIARRLNPVITAKWHSGFVGTWVFRIITLLGFFYLIYDRFYETSATISSPVLNVQRQFVFVFTITNNSHLFTIRNVSWNCITDHMKTTNGSVINNVEIAISGSSSEILPGQDLNINCNTTPRGGPAFPSPPDVKISEATIRIKISYDADIFGFFSLRHISPSPTRFSWFTEGATPQWIRGDFPK